MPRRDSPEDDDMPRDAPATTPAGREAQMIELADSLAEKQLRAGTASSQVITHYLKLGTSREVLEQEKIANENLRLRAQVAQLEAAQKDAGMMDELMKQLRRYSGVEDDFE